MSDLNIPDNIAELENRSLTDLARYLPESANPFLEESWMGAQAIANARRVFEFYIQLRILELEAIPVTAVEKLELWGSYWGIIRKPASQANGNVVATGTPGSIIPQGTELQSSDGNSYSVANDATVQTTNIIPSSITSLGTTATVQLPSDQSLFTGLEVTIAGANEPEYNGTFPIVVTNTDEFTYELPTATSSPATGSITVSFTTASIAVQSVGFGQDQNLEPNTPLNFATPVVGVDNQAFVDFGTIGGGSDQETDEELRDRLLDRVQNPVANFNVAAIANEARKVPGVTDVFIFEITPVVGAVTIYPIRGNDANPIPDPSEVQAVKDQILTIKPAHTSDDDVVVLAATPVNATFTFSFLTPDNTSVRNQIDANLDALFRDEGAVSEAITFEQYNAAIVNAGAQDYVLDSPVGDIGGGVGEYPVYLGSNFI